MVTFAQAQERAEEWINGDVPAYQHREVRVREFELGFVVWAEDRETGPVSDGGRQRLVLARDSGEATLWPSLPVGEVIRRYEEEYGLPDGPAEPAAPRPPERVDLNQTSFLLSPPEWLQEAADKLGIPDRRESSSSTPSTPPSPSAPSTPSAVPPATPSPAAPVAPAPARAAAEPQDSVPAAPEGATPWAGTDTNGAGDEEDRSVPLPETVFSPPLSEDMPPPGVTPEAKTALISGGSRLPRTAESPSLGGPPAPTYGYPQGPGGSNTPPPPGGSTPLPPPGAPQYGYPQGPAGSNVPPSAPGSAPSPVPGAPLPPPAPGSAVPGTPPAAPGAPQYGYPQGPAGSNVPPPAPGSAPLPVPGAPLPPPAPGSAVPGTPPAAPAAPQYGYPQGPAGSNMPPSAPGSAPLPVPGAPLPPPAPGSAVPGTPPPAPGAPQYGYPQGPGGSHTPPPSGPARDAAGRPLAPGAGDIADVATSKAQPPHRGGGQTPPPPGAPGVPGAPAGGYVPTQLVSSLGPDGQPQAPGAPTAPRPPGSTPPPPGGMHHAATILSGPAVGAPGGQAPPPPGPPGVPGAPQQPAAPRPPGSTPPPPGGTGGGAHHAATMLAGPGPQAPQGPVGPPPGAMPPPTPGQQIPGGPPPAAYGYPQQAAPPMGQPTVGPGYQAVLRYRAPDGSEQQLIRRSAPGTPHPEWQIFHELRGMNIPADQVLELHTELESCALPGAYCSRMIKEQWPQARITSIAPYGTDHASRQQGMQQLIAHQGELHQVADGPARPAPVRAPLPPAQPAPPVPPEGIAQELAAAFGPGVFRFDQRAVSRQGVPDVVAHTLVVAGLPADFGPFFWAQAQPGRPVPTLAELAQERGVQPAPDAGSYLVMGSDFGKAVCVQYGTANIVAVPVEAGPGGGPVPPQFVNSGLPEFARSLGLLGRMWRLRYGLNQEQAGRWTVDFQAQLNGIDPAALGSPETWWSVLLEQMWDGLL
ncbi:SUKH-4 family immunity protein [Streptomyces sp. NPDC102467]|uniref:SUKH-4 family immunity protein n=1 Tax=Streptomyces sp. NPDC102467 TaxID=3366179 RepID=UPI00381E9183